MNSHAENFIIDQQLSYSLTTIESAVCRLWTVSRQNFWGVLQFCRLNDNINHKGLQRTANEYAGERRIYEDLISKTITHHHSRYQYHHSISTIYGCYGRKTCVSALRSSRRIHKDPRLNVAFAKSSVIVVNL